GGRRIASPDDLARWIKELEDRSYQVRQKAMKALEEVGQPAVKALTAAAASASPETQRRVKLLLERIEINEAVAPTLVRLHLRDVPLPAAVEELAKQSRLKLELVPQQGPGRLELEQKRVNLELERATFWEALEKLCQAGGLSYATQGTATLKLH